MNNNVQIWNLKSKQINAGFGRAVDGPIFNKACKLLYPKPDEFFYNMTQTTGADLWEYLAYVLGKIWDHLEYKLSEYEITK